VSFCRCTRVVYSSKGLVTALSREDGEDQMFLRRVAWSIASIFLGLTATVAQGQVQGTVALGKPPRH
jgi:hypothetical protein